MTKKPTGKKKQPRRVFTLAQKEQILAEAKVKGAIATCHRYRLARSAFESWKRLAEAGKLRASGSGPLLSPEQKTELIADLRRGMAHEEVEKKYLITRTHTLFYAKKYVSGDGTESPTSAKQQALALPEPGQTNEKAAEAMTVEQPEEEEGRQLSTGQRLITKAEKLAVVARFKAGERVKTLSQELGMSKATIYGWVDAAANGTIQDTVSRFTIPDETKRRIIDEIDNGPRGTTVVAVAAKYRVSPSNIGHWRRQLELEKDRRPPTETTTMVSTRNNPMPTEIVSSRAPTQIVSSRKWGQQREESAEDARDNAEIEMLRTSLKEALRQRDALRVMVDILQGEKGDRA